MVKFKYSSLIDAPVELVWKFHERSDILELLTPPWLAIQVIRREGGLEVGATSEVKIFVGSIPVKWLAVHTECQKHYLFTDEQQEGPFAKWVHRHRFSAENNKTLLTDDIDFSLPGGFLTDFLASWLIMMQLDQIFHYRHQVTHRECRLLQQN